MWLAGTRFKTRGVMRIMCSAGAVQNRGDANHVFGRYAFQNLGAKTVVTRITCLACMRSKTWVTQITGLVGTVYKLKIGTVQIDSLLIPTGRGTGILV